MKSESKFFKDLLYVAICVLHVLFFDSRNICIERNDDYYFINLY